MAPEAKTAVGRAVVFFEVGRSGESGKTMKIFIQWKQQRKENKKHKQNTKI